MTILFLAAVCTLLALVPAGMFRANLRLFKALPPAKAIGPAADPVPTATQDQHPQRPVISVLIPARNEERNISVAIQSALAHDYPSLEILILDDQSIDSTCEIVREMEKHDSRIRLILGTPLPPGWCGKQFACWTLALESRGDLLVFMDADVRLEPHAIDRAASFMRQSAAPLASGFPRQITGTFLEKLLLPLMHFVLLGFLPLWKMQQNASPAYGAGCGQLFIARRTEYFAADGHRAIRLSRHDGITLPRAFRRAGLRTDLFDATDFCSCRMYASAGAVWTGLAKNATEGIANPRLILPASLVLIGGQVMPLAFLAWAIYRPSPWLYLISYAGCTAVYLPRSIAAVRFRQSWLGVVLHPVGIILLAIIQWYALCRQALGRPVAWRGRTP